MQCKEGSRYGLFESSRGVEPVMNCMVRLLTVNRQRDSANFFLQHAHAIRQGEFLAAVLLILIAENSYLKKNKEKTSFHETSFARQSSLPIGGFKTDLMGIY